MIPYGGRAVALSLRRRLRVVAPPGIAALRDVPSAVTAALEHPSAGPPLRRLVKRGEPVTVVVSDHTRATGADRIVTPLLSYLCDCGVAPERIFLLFATGIHRRQTEEERAAIVGQGVASTAHLVDHEADSSEQLRRIGVTSAGTPVVLNQLVGDGRLVVLTGTVSFHYLAGFGGGRKSILPGVAGREAVVAFHRRCLSAGPGEGRHPRAWPGVTAGNPMDGDAREAASMLDRAFMLNTGMTLRGEVAELFSGNLEAAFDLATAWCRLRLAVTLKRRVPVVVVGAGGRPRDCNLVQAHKALEMAWRACLPGGVIVLVAECADGLGNDRMVEWLESGDSRRHEARLRENFDVNGFTALALRWKCERFRVLLCSSLAPALVRKLGMTPVAPDEIWDCIDSLAGRECPGVVLPGGAVPLLATAGAEVGELP